MKYIVDIKGEIEGDYEIIGKYEERPQGDCQNCDFRKFSETFINGIVGVMTKNGIESVEQLSEILKGGAE